MNRAIFMGCPACKGVGFVVDPMVRRWEQFGIRDGKPTVLFRKFRFAELCARCHGLGNVAISTFKSDRRSQRDSAILAGPLSI